MSDIRTPHLFRPARLALCAAIAALGPTLSLPGFTATTDIREEPLINSQVSVKPNLMFVLDNSGSMDRAYLPDNISNTSMKGYRSSQCNGVAFNPDEPYDLPVTADGRTYPQIPIATAWDDGFQPPTTGDTFNITAALNSDTPDPTTGATITLTLTVSTSNPWSNGDLVVVYDRNDPSHWLLGTVSSVSTGGSWWNATATYTINLTFSSFRGGTVSSWRIGKISTTNLARTSSGQSVEYYNRYTGNQPAMAWRYTASGNVDTSDTFVSECRNTGNSSVFTKVPFSDLTDEQKQRYANWYAYYRTRILMMRSAAGRAMYALDDSFRVGFTTINKPDSSANDSVTPALGRFANVADFNPTHKANFFSNLYGSAVGGGTPLRVSLAKVGRYYGNKFSGQTDPIQHACQRNFTLLTTDGFWNENSNPKQLDGLTNIGNQDGVLANSPRPQYDNSQHYTLQQERTNYETQKGSCGTGKYQRRSFTERRDAINTPAGVTYTEWVTVPNTTTNWGSCGTQSTTPGTISDKATTAGGGASNTLADVAAYYYKTDLRPDLPNSVPRFDDDPATHQHMTTYTLGMGLSGTLRYTSNYLKLGDPTNTSDYAALIAGTLNWPPVSGTSETDPAKIDDLWHAAVNGHGRYFSADNPTALVNSLSEALGGMDGKNGAGASAASTSLRPVLGTDQIFIASYRTVDWLGELEARTLRYDTSSNEITVGTENRAWLASSLLNGRTYSDRTIYYMRREAAATGSTSSLGTFTYDDLSTDADSATLLGYFNNYCSKTPRPTQCSALTPTQQTSASGANLVNFLRGDRTHESTLFRNRASVLGDMVDASPVYVGKPPFRYQDAGYAAYVNNHADRCPVVYAAANDGMLHAFSAKTDQADCPDAGTEMWAYIPRAVMPRLYMLADRDYKDLHRFYVNATPVVADVADNSGDTPEWRSILVGGLGAGGRGYYALDVTDPASPALRWEFTDADLGLTYGNPIVTKVPDASGTPVWAVVFTSGLNNSGNGYLYVLNALTGAVIYKVPTLISGQPVGTASTPSGLNKLNAWVNDPADNTALRFYAGDMLGNLWRFNADELAIADNQVGTVNDTRALRLANFTANNTAQPITVVPELAEINYAGARYPIVLVGTGRYLGNNDLSDTTTQSVYAVRDPLTSTGWGNVRDSMVEQTITDADIDTDDDPSTPAVSARIITRHAVNWSDSGVAGWFVDLPDDGERVAVGMSLAYTTLTVATVVPSTDICNGSGYSWLYDFNIATGSSLSTQVVGYKLDIAVMGINTLQFDNDGNMITGQTLTKSDGSVEIRKTNGQQGTTSLRRTSWRELTP